MGSDPTDDSADTFEFPGPPGGFVDLAAAHLLTDGQPARRRAACTPTASGTSAGSGPPPSSTTAGDGFVEDAWVGRHVALGDAPSSTSFMPTVRCAMPTRAQPGGLGRGRRRHPRPLNQQHNGNLGVYCWP